MLKILTKSMHPPAGGTAFFYGQNCHEFGLFQLIPTYVGSLSLVLIAIAVNRYVRKIAYPNMLQ